MDFGAILCHCGTGLKQGWDALSLPSRVIHIQRVRAML